jgi:uncharacterized membrane protein
MRRTRQVFCNDNDLSQSPKLSSRQRSRIVFVLAAMLTWMVTAMLPAGAVSVGDKASGFLILGNKQIPLPIGEWVVAGLGTQPLSMPKEGAFGTIETAVLFLPQGNNIDTVLEVNTNAIPVNDGWGRPKACTPGKQQLALVTRYKTGWETSCAFVEATRFGAESAGPPAWEQARDFARREKLAMPELWLTAGFRISDRQDIVDARFHFNPSLIIGGSAAGYPALADWTREWLRDDPIRSEAVRIMSSWTAGFAHWFERGMRNQITTPPGPMPETAAYLSTTPETDLKLLGLDRLYRSGSITWASYQEQSHAAIDEVPAVKEQTSSGLSNSVKKNLSFRSLGTFVDYGIAYMVTASNAVSWAIALTINSTDSVWFVMNDQYWDDYYAKLNAHDADRIVDFTYIGEGVKA